MQTNRIHISESFGGRLDPLQFHYERMDMIHNIMSTKQWCKLKDVVRNVKTTTKELSVSDVYIGLENIASNTGDYIPTSEKNSISSAAIFAMGDILFPKLRPYLNKVYRAEFDGKCSTEFHVFQAKKIDADFLTIVLRSNLIVAQTKHLMTGNTLPRLQTSDIENLIIPLPPMSVQQEIVAMYTKAQEEKQTKEAQAKVLLDSIDSYLLGELGITLPETTQRKLDFKVNISALLGSRIDTDYNNQSKYKISYDAICESKYKAIPLLKISSAIFQGVGKNETNDNTFTLLKVKNILIGNEINFNNVEYVKSVPEQKRLKYNDIIAPFIGEAIRQIKFSVFKADGCYTVDNNTGVIRVADYNNPNYVAEYLCSILGKVQINRLIGGGGVPFLGSDKIGKILVCIPPIEKQTEIADRISQIRSHAKRLQAEALQTLTSAKQQIEKIILG